MIEKLHIGKIEIIKKMKSQALFLCIKMYEYALHEYTKNCIKIHG